MVTRQPFNVQVKPAMKNGDGFRWVEEALRWRMFDDTVQGIKLRNADQEPAALQALIDQALDAVRHP